MRPALLNLLCSLGVAGLGTIAFFVLAYLVWPGSRLTEVFLSPGFVLLPALWSVLPEGIIYALVPEGGGPAVALLVVAGSFFTWGVVSLLAWSATRRVVSWF